MSVYEIPDPDSFDFDSPDFSEFGSSTGFSPASLVPYLTDVWSPFPAMWAIHFHSSEVPFPELETEVFGSMQFGYAYNWESFESDVTVEVNTPSARVDLSGGEIISTQYINSEELPADGNYVTALEPEWTFRVSGDQLPSPGQYKLEVHIKDEDEDVNNFVNCTIRRNGFPIAVALYMRPSNLQSTYNWIELTDYRPFGGYDPDIEGPSVVPVLSGDEYEFAFWKDGSDTTPEFADEFEIDGLRWHCYKEGGSSGPAIVLLEPNEYPEGATDESDIPLIHQLQDVNDDPYNQVDMIILDSDDVVCGIWVDVAGSPGGLTAAARLICIKYDVSSQTWSLLTNDPLNIGGPDGAFTSNDNLVDGVAGFSMASDGTDIYFVHSRGFGSLSAFSRREMRIHVTKVDGSSGAVSDVGGAITAIASNLEQSRPGQYETGPIQIAVSPMGVPWISWTQNNPDIDPLSFNGVDFGSLMYCYRYIETSPTVFDWVDTELPQFVNPHAFATLPSGDAAAIQVYPLHGTSMTFCTKDGPGENPSIVWMVWYDADNPSGPDFDFDKPIGEWYYHEWTGSEWAEAYKFRFADYYPPGDEFFFTRSAVWDEKWTQGFDLVNDGNTPILAAALGEGLNFGGIGVLKMDTSGVWQPLLSSQKIMRSPVDRAYLWVDASACQVAVTDDSKIYVTFDSSYFGWWTIGFLQTGVDTGTRDGSTWAMKEKVPGFLGATNAPARLLAKGTTLYWLSLCELYRFDGSGPDVEYSNTAMLWIIPRSEEVHIPWTDAAPVSFNAMESML
jgi:hypothetical protein